MDPRAIGAVATYAAARGITGSCPCHIRVSRFQTSEIKRDGLVAPITHVLNIVEFPYSRFCSGLPHIFGLWDSESDE